MIRPASRSAVALCALTVLFGCRVAGQALVAIFGVTWLPPMDAWFSGLLPYPLLLPLQIVILLVQVAINRDVWRGQGFFAHPRPRAGRRIQWLACAYALSMVVRYAITHSHAIPVVFHWVLAAYIFTLGARLRDRHAGTTSPTRRFLATIRVD